MALESWFPRDTDLLFKTHTLVFLMFHYCALFCGLCKQRVNYKCIHHVCSPRRYERKVHSLFFDNNLVIVCDDTLSKKNLTESHSTEMFILQISVKEYSSRVFLI